MSMEKAIVQYLLREHVDESGQVTEHVIDKIARGVLDVDWGEGCMQLTFSDHMTIVPLRNIIGEIVITADDSNG